MGYGRYFEGRMIGRRYSQCKDFEAEKEFQEIRIGQVEELGNVGGFIGDKVKEVLFVFERDIL